MVEGLSWFKEVDVSCGWGHTAVIIDNGKLFTWGVGEYGALGISDCTTQWFPVQVVFKEKYRVNIKAVSCGTRHTAMVDDMVHLFTCVAGAAVQLGTGSRERQIQTINTSLKEKAIGTGCGIFHTLMLTLSGSVLEMGGNNFGQLGTGARRSSAFPLPVKGLERERIVKVAAGHVSGALTENGSIYLWGTGAFGEWLVPTRLEGLNGPVKDIQIGANFGGAIDFNGNVYSWGTNASGELGLGDYNERISACQLNSMKGKCVVELSCGGSYMIALGKTLPYKFVSTSQTEGIKTNISNESNEKIINEVKEQTMIDVNNKRSGENERILNRINDRVPNERIPVGRNERISSGIKDRRSAETNECLSSGIKDRIPIRNPDIREEPQPNYIQSRYPLPQQIRTNDTYQPISHTHKIGQAHA